MRIKNRHATCLIALLVIILIIPKARSLENNYCNNARDDYCDADCIRGIDPDCKTCIRNNICERGETETNCPEDCAQKTELRQKTPIAQKKGMSQEEYSMKLIVSAIYIIIILLVIYLIYRAVRKTK